MQADFLRFRTNKERKNAKNAKRKKQKNGVDSKQNKNESGYSLNLNLDLEASSDLGELKIFNAKTKLTNNFIIMVTILSY
jgi:hypothetical protein